MVGEGLSLTVDDQNLADGSTPGSTSSTDSIVFTPGSDAIASIVFGDTTGLDGGLTWERVSDTEIVGRDSGGTTVVTLTLVRDGNTADVTVTLNDNYHHSGSGDDLANLGSVKVVATDTDGDAAEGTVNVGVSDDVPVAADDDGVSVVEGGAAISGNVMTNDTPGADGAKVTSVTIGGNEHAVAAEGTTTVTTPNGTYTFQSNGAWTFTPVASLNNAEGVSAGFTYVITDGDGDTSSAAQPITIIDGAGPSPVGDGLSLVVKEADLDQVKDSTDLAAGAVTGSNPGGTGETNSGTLTFQAGSDALVSFGFANPALVANTITVTDEANNPVAVSWSINADGQLVGTIGGAVAIIVAVDGSTIAANAQGTVGVKVTLTDNFPHANGQSGDVSIGGIKVVATDADGDTATGTVSVTVKDDVPTAGANNTVYLDDETANATNASPNPGGTGDYNGTPPAATTGVLSHNYGADGAGSLLLSGVTLPVSGGFSYVLSPDKLSLTIMQNQGGSNVAVVKVTLADQTSGSYVVEQLKPVMHPTSGTTEENVDFTIRYDVRDGDGDVASGGSVTISVNDDTPTISASNDLREVIVDETNFNVDARVSFASAFTSSYGADGAGSVSYALSFTGPATYLVDIATGKSVVLSMENGQVIGRAGEGGAIVFKISVDADGYLTVDQIRAIEHPVTSDPNDARPFLSENLLQLTATITDRDGDSRSASINLNNNIYFKDDGPSVSANQTVLLDDDALANGNPNGTGDQPDSVKAAGTLGHQFGADGAGSITWLTTGSPAPAGFEYRLNGTSLEVWQGAIKVLTVTLNSATGAYEVTQNAPIVHAAGGNENDQAFDLTYQVKDGDGDTINGTLKISVNDDTPVANDYAGGSYVEGSGAHVVGDAVDLLGIAPGADGLSGTLQQIVFTGGSGGGSVVIDANGRLVYTPVANVVPGGKTETFSYTVTDKDGDTVTKQVTFGVTDTGVTNVSATNASVDEDNIAGAVGNAGGPGDLATPVPSGTISYTLGADGGSNVAVSLSAAAVGFTKLDGTAINTIWDAANKVLIGYGGANQSDVVFKISLSAIGTAANSANSATYNVELVQPVKHPGQDTEDDLSISVTATVKDGDGSTATTGFTVTIDDDTPVAANDSNTLKLVVDDLGVSEVVAGWAITAGGKGIVYSDDDHDNANDQVRWGTGGQSGYGFVDNSAAVLDNLHTNETFYLGEFTHYNQSIDNGSSISAARLTVSFTAIINGEPVLVGPIVIEFEHNETPNNGTADQNRDIITITTTTTTINIDGQNYTLDVRGFVDPSNNNNIVSTVRTYEDMSNSYQLAVRFVSSDSSNVSCKGNVIDNDLPGADGGLAVVSATGYAGSSDNTVDVSGNFDILGRYGKLTINKDGTYTYVLTADGASVPAGTKEVFTYTVSDADGDRSTANLTIDLNKTDAGDNFAINDRVITNISGAGAAIAISEAALLYNDAAGTTIPGNASNISDAQSVTHSNGNFVFTDNDADGGKFTYTGNSGASSDGAVVTVDRSQAGNSTLNGTSLGDILIGRDVADTINGGAGNDYLVGNGGNDILDGGAGADTLLGGDGDDTLIADQADKLLHGGAGTDTLQLGANFTSTSDAQIVEIEKVVLTAASVLNLSNQQEGFTIIGSSGADSITGGAGNDIIVAAQNDTLINGGGGIDTLQVGANFASTSDSQIVSIENVVLTTAATLSLANQTEGFNITGSSGSDTITGGFGADTISAGNGDDTINLANGHFAAGESIDGGFGNDRIVLTNGTTVDFSTGSISSVETLTGSSSSDNVTMSAQQWAAFNTINLAGGSNDVLNVKVEGAVDISLASTTSVSSVETGSLVGGINDDSIKLSGSQLDAILNGSGKIDLGGGNNTINLTSTSSDLNGLSDSSLTNVSTISASSSGSAVTINLANQSEAFSVTGSASNDTLTGGSGNDVINGGAGSDRITGGRGADTMTGGAGNDTFVINRGDTEVNIGGSGTGGTISGYDVIKDFNTSQDKLTLDGSPFAAGNILKTNGNNSALTIGGIGVANQVSQHSVSNGMITFYKDAGGALSLGSLQDVAAVVQYLRANDLGSGDVTVAFTATIGGLAHTFIYQQVGSTPSTSNDILVDLENVTISNLSTLISNNVIDPIMLDLDHNGYTFSDIGGGVQFDINADGHQDQIAWNTSGDGILAYDVDGNGQIDNGSEIFTPNFAGGNYATGSEALASLDSNGDGVIDANDEAFAKLLIWQDFNKNGISDDGELTHLADHGIVGIDTGTTATTGEIDGQTVIGQGTFHYADGSTGSFVEVALGSALGAHDSQAPAGETFVIDGLDVADIIPDYDGGKGDQLDLSALLKGLAPDTDLGGQGYVSVVQNGANAEVKVDADGGGDNFQTVAVLENYTHGGGVSDTVRVLFEDNSGNKHPDNV